MGDKVLKRFEHVTVADLSKKDKENFARRWYDVTASTETVERRAIEAKALVLQRKVAQDKSG
jgi:hypothetical protein